MLVGVRRSVLAGLAGLVVLGLLGSPARAQFVQVSPGRFEYVSPTGVGPNTLAQNTYNMAHLGRAQTAFFTGAHSTGLGVGSLAPYQQGAVLGYNWNPYISTNNTPFLTSLNNPNPGSVAIPGGGGGGYPVLSSGGGYGNPYLPPSSPSELYSGLYSGGLSGTTDLKTIQEARYAELKTDMGRVDLRRRLAEEARYERMNIPSTEELRQQEMKRDLERARNNPPVGEILSGKALNDLAHHLEDVQSKGARGPNVQLDEETLRHINVVAPSSKGGNVGLLLKDDGKLSWPPALLGKEFKEAREEMSKALENAVQKIKFKNPLEAGNKKDLKDDWKKLNDLVQQSELPPSDYIEARQYLEQVRDAVTALQDDNVANYFNQTWAAKGKTVAELIENMKGMDFAPASPGDERAYRVLHIAMAAYDYGMSPLASREKEKP